MAYHHESIELGVLDVQHHYYALRKVRSETYLTVRAPIAMDGPARTAMGADGCICVVGGTLEYWPCLALAQTMASVQALRVRFRDLGEFGTEVISLERAREIARACSAQVAVLDRDAQVRGLHWLS